MNGAIRGCERASRQLVASPCSPYASRWVFLRSGSTNLNRLNVYFFYECGQAIQALHRSAEKDKPLSELSYPCFNAIRWLDALLGEESLVLQVVRSPVQKLKARIENLQSMAQAATKVASTATPSEAILEGPKTLGILDAFCLSGCFSKPP
jgi:hypothetical protein